MLMIEIEVLTLRECSLQGVRLIEASLATLKVLAKTMAKVMAMVMTMPWLRQWPCLWPWARMLYKIWAVR